MISPVILQEGNITNTENYRYVLLGLAFFGGVVVCFLFVWVFFVVVAIPNEVSANLKFIHYIYRI